MRPQTACQPTLKHRAWLPPIGTFALLALGLGGCGAISQQAETRPQVTLRVADAALSSGAPELALRVADIVLTKEPKNGAALTARGDALYALGQAGPAGEAYRAAAALDPKSVGAQLGLGRSLVRGNPQAAEAAFLAATVLDPQNGAAWSNLGVARDLQQNHAGAQQAYRAALAVEPAASDVRMNLGLSLALSGQADAAVAMLRPLAGEAGASQLSRADLAVALAQAGDTAGARRALAGGADGTTASLAPEPPVAQLQAAQIAPSPVAPSGTTATPVPQHADTATAAPVPQHAAAAIRSDAPQALPAPRIAVTQVTAPPLPNPVHVPEALVARIADPAAAITDTAPPSHPMIADVAPALHQTTTDIALTPHPTTTGIAPASRATTTDAAPAAHGATTDVMATSRAAKADAAPTSHAAIPDAAPASHREVADARSLPQVVAAHVAPSPGAASGPVSVQLAAVRSEQSVAYEWRRLQTRMPSLLGGRALTVSQSQNNSQNYWRLRTGGFANLAEANQFCAKVRAAGSGCLPVVTQSE